MYKIPFILAKKQALEKGTTLKKTVESALHQSLYQSKESKTGFRLRWRTVRGNRIPGFDISDRDSLYEQMEGRG